jgi:hypothetical protein
VGGKLPIGMAPPRISRLWSYGRDVMSDITCPPSVDLNTI